MQFTFEMNSEEVEAALEELSSSIESGEQARAVADDFRDVLAARPPAKSSKRSTNILGPRQLGAIKKASD